MKVEGGGQGGASIHLQGPSCWEDRGWGSLKRVCTGRLRPSAKRSGRGKPGAPPESGSVRLEKTGHRWKLPALAVGHTREEGTGWTQCGELLRIKS